MPHKIDLTGTKIVKSKTHRLLFKDGKFKAISNGRVIFESKKFAGNNIAKLNIKAVKRFFEKLSYTEIDLEFR